MTTRATLADGTTFDYDEETQAHPTGVNDQLVVSRVFTGPTPPKAAGAPGETPAQRRDRLRAELAALEDEEDEGGGTAAPDLFPPIA